MNSETENDNLGPDNESDNDSIISDNPAAENYEACKVAAKNFNGLNTEFPEIEAALLKMKSTIYFEMFQNGETEKVHDTERLNDYVNICSNLYRHITNSETLINSENNIISAAISEFLTVLQSHTPTSILEKQMLDAYLHLHLVCFCYCHNSDCLSMDDVEPDSE